MSHCRKNTHKHLTSVLGICCDSPQPYIIKEYIAGNTLKALLQTEKLAWSKILKIVRALLVHVAIVLLI